MVYYGLKIIGTNWMGYQLRIINTLKITVIMYAVTEKVAQEISESLQIDINTVSKYSPVLKFVRIGFC